MEKLFFEVFPTFEPGEHLRGLLADCTVTKVTATKSRDDIGVYLDCPHLIRKEDLRFAEREMKKQLFPGSSVLIRIRERFHLSAQYTPETLFEFYGESVLSEIREYNPVMYTLLKGAEITFPGGDVCEILLPDTLTAHESAKEMQRILEKIFNDRCGVATEFQFSFDDSADDEEETYEDAASFGGSRTAMPDYSAEIAAAVEQIAVAQAAGEEGGDTGEKKGNAGSRAGARKARRDGQTNLPVRRRTGSFSSAGTQGPGGGNRGNGGFSGGGFSPRREFKKEDYPDLLYGRPFTDDPMPIGELDGESNRDVCIRGQIFHCDSRTGKSGKQMLLFDLYDGTDSISLKMFLAPEAAETLTKEMKKGAFVKVKGIPRMDSFDHELNISSPVGIMKIQDFMVHRSDKAPVKRIELHCHTKMSDMDGVSDCKDIVKRAYQWGMPGIAITDHGVVQALTDAGHVFDDLYKDAKKAAEAAGEPVPDRQQFFKIIQGVECYLVDDLRQIVVNGKGQPMKDTPYVVFDLETTGFSPRKNRIIEFGAVRVENGKITGRFSEFVNPEVPIPYKITQLTSITDEMVIGAETIETVLPRFVEFCRGAVLVGHNVAFDISFINENCYRQEIDADYTTIDTLGLSRAFFPRQGRHTLDAVAKTLGIDLGHHHRAVDDAEATAGIFLKFLGMLEERGIQDLEGVNVLGASTPEAARHLRPSHATILAKNTLGRVNLYTLISLSHLHYLHHYQHVPLIPKSLLQQYREGLLVGSACARGELFRAIEEDRPDREIAGIVGFYDYLEIQPIENNRDLIASESHEHVENDEDLRTINRRILALGRQFHKTVCATGDVHFLDPSDQIYRRIIMEDKRSKGNRDEADTPMYLRTTDEMLACFDYLGTEDAKEVVLNGPRRIFDMCDSVTPVRPDKCAPEIPDSDRILKEICYDRAHEIYGDPLPAVVEERLARELNSIISNGFAVMYIIAQKLVWKSVEDGYLVGSRGSVGSSFVAFTAGITEVNSLAPHYVCPKCKYSDFDSEEVKAFGGKSGCDMPDKVCPVCGEKLYKDGFDIPFETFLGFKGDKEPDIDLNFSGEYQAKAHQYTEVIFGKGQTYRAGTISALADKTAYGFVKKYFDAAGETPRKCEVNRVTQGCTGVRRGTGQHPGGIIVLPVGQDINSFTPVQHPANDTETPIITTHYDYHSIDHNLLKLDILGHDDPTMIRFLQDVTGIDPTTVPLDDKEVMQLFINTDSLGITPEQIGGTKLGCLGLPEFGTDFAMQMVIDAKPTSFSHLVRIAGLAHGTDVWLGNAKDLIMEGTATIDTAICTRDDIMIYLIQKGMDKSLSFKTMESVRKGKGLTPEMKEAMEAVGVPQWYIDSCIKIKYMFPKAHAAAYVMMAWRIAWFKVHHPVAFYAAWFSIRAKAFNYEHMCQGEVHLHTIMQDYQHRKDELTNMEQLELGDMRVAEEMYERGIEFLPIDLFKAKARSFQVIDGKIMPSFLSIADMGPIAADAVEAAAKDGAFLSRDDFRDRTKCPAKVIDTMARLGILGDIPESNQMSLFDLM